MLPQCKLGIIPNLRSIEPIVYKHREETGRVTFRQNNLLFSLVIHPLKAAQPRCLALLPCLRVAPILSVKSQTASPKKHHSITQASFHFYNHCYFASFTDPVLTFPIEFRCVPYLGTIWSCLYKANVFLRWRVRHVLT